MKGYPKVLHAAVSLFLLTCCGESSSAPAGEVIPVKVTSPANEGINDAEKPPVKDEKEGELRPSGYTVACEEREEKHPKSEDPILIKTCTYRKYRTVSIGSPDFNGRYSWEHSLYKVQEGEYAKVDNSSLFNQEQGDLLRQINQRIEADYLALSNDPETRDCFVGAEPIREFRMDELGISFETGKLVFHVGLGLPSACLAVDGTAVAFTIKEVEQYLNK